MTAPHNPIHPEWGAGAPWSWPRFARLARAQWAEQRRAYLGHLLICSILYVVLLMFLLGLTSMRGFLIGVQAVFYFGGLYLTGFVFAARYFDGMARRESALLLLMRPASALEKWLLCFAVVALAYPVVYTLLFLAISWPVQQLLLAIAERIALPGPWINGQKLALFIPLRPPRPDASWMTVPQQLAFFIGVGALQALAVSGSLYFRRAALLKTVALAVALALLTSLVSALAGARGDVLLAWWQPRPERHEISVHIVNALLWLGLPAVLWLQALMHLREKELA